MEIKLNANKLKKIGVILAAGILAVSSLTSCSANTSENGNSQANVSPSESAASSAPPGPPSFTSADNGSSHTLQTPSGRLCRNWRRIWDHVAFMGLRCTGLRGPGLARRTKGRACRLHAPSPRLLSYIQLFLHVFFKNLDLAAFSQPFEATGFFAGIPHISTIYIVQNSHGSFHFSSFFSKNLHFSQN